QGREGCDERRSQERGGGAQEKGAPRRDVHGRGPWLRGRESHHPHYTSEESGLPSAGGPGSRRGAQGAKERGDAVTEAEWMACTDPTLMLELFRGTRLHPKLRRFAVECCRRIRHLLVEEEFWAAARAGEAFADDPHNRRSTMKAMAAAAIRGW